MPWSSRRSGTRRNAFILGCVVCVAFLATYLALGFQHNDQQIAVYSIAANYSLPIASRNGQDYVGLLEILEPLGTVSAGAENGKWILRFDESEGQFTPGTTQAIIRGETVNLASPFLLENDRGLVPLSSIPFILPRFLGTSVSLNLSSRRLFIGNVAVHFTAQVSRNNPSTVEMDFTSPVNPTVSTEPGKLTLKFTHEALMPPGTPVLTFDSKTISSAAYQESNGIAEIIVSGTVPLFATFSNDGRTITIGPPPEIVVREQANQAATLAAPAPPASGIQAPTNSPVIPSRAFVVVDAAHGGQEPGASLSAQLAEKDVTLAIALRLRQELTNRGISTLLLRDTDATLTLDQRATTTNQTHPAMYLVLHASSQGTGVRLYTALLPASGENHGPFLNWSTAQGIFLNTSQQAESVIAAELQKNQIPYRMFSAPLRPLNNIEASAVAVEVAPSVGGGVSDLSSPGYQQYIANSLAAGIADLHFNLGAGR
jgi:N-acetylmuramoyl-L-alanine amidase